LAVDAADQLGEGPCWVAAEGRLYWFDIKGRRLHWHAPETGEIGKVALPMRVSAAAPRQAGGLLLSTEHGLVCFDPRTLRLDLVRPIELPAGFRTNDGKVDPQGRFWWSSMDDNDGERPGEIFVTHPDGRTETVLAGVHIPNTISVTADGRTLYLADSKLGVIYACDTSDLTSRRVFARTPEGAAPDGSALDEAGYLWNAQWGAWRIVRYAPDGAIDRIVEVPVEQPTSCAFGGDDLATLFVTSAWDGLSKAARAAQPQAGGLFAFEPGVRGLALPTFNG
jgi:sugar lactone lactonase YvrE